MLFALYLPKRFAPKILQLKKLQRFKVPEEIFAFRYIVISFSFMTKNPNNVK